MTNPNFLVPFNGIIVFEYIFVCLSLTDNDMSKQHAKKITDLKKVFDHTMWTATKGASKSHPHWFIGQFQLRLTNIEILNALSHQYGTHFLHVFLYRQWFTVQQMSSIVASVGSWSVYFNLIPFNVFIWPILHVWTPMMSSFSTQYNEIFPSTMRTLWMKLWWKSQYHI